MLASHLGELTIQLHSFRNALSLTSLVVLISKDSHGEDRAEKRIEKKDHDLCFASLTPKKLILRA